MKRFKLLIIRSHRIFIPTWFSCLVQMLSILLEGYIAASALIALEPPRTLDGGSGVVSDFIPLSRGLFTILAFGASWDRESNCQSYFGSPKACTTKPGSATLGSAFYTLDSSLLWRTNNIWESHLTIAPAVEANLCILGSKGLKLQLSLMIELSSFLK